MLDKAVPFSAWVLTPGFAPKEVEIVEAGYYVGYFSTAARKHYFHTELYQSKREAVESGWRKLDERVSGAPGGKYPNAKISCYGIARQDIGYGPGIYKVGVGASWGGKAGLKPGKHHPLCRCIAIAMIQGVNYFPKDG